MARTFRRLLPLALGLLALWGAAGCGARKVLEPLSTPHTYIFIQGPVDTVNHIVKLHWYGTDAHGYIAGYEVRLLNPLAAADSAWRFTVATDTTLTVLTPTGFTEAVFEARAINDRGVRDPDPARQTFDFSNQPPVLRIVGKPNPLDHSDTTFASVTVTWTVSDPDGNADAVVSRAWLDGRQDSPQLAHGTSFTMPSAEFLQGGAYLSGPRTLYMQPIDDGGMAGAIDSCTWYVRQPVPTRVDTLYSNAIARTGIDPTTVRLLHLSASQPFRSAADLAQTLGLFESVVWYRGELASLPATLMSYGDGVGQYLEHGGRLFLESLNLIRAWRSSGPFDVDFVQRYLNSDGVFLFGQPPDSSATWGVSSTRPTVLLSPVLTDSVLAKRNIAGLRGFISRARSQMLLTAPAFGLTQQNPIEIPVALDVPQQSGGSMIIVTFPMVTGTVDASPSDTKYVTSPFPQRSSVVLLGMLQRLGLSGP
ncbi:MAG: hypothetical protein E6K80_02000 [Candidatus Eisenbacteria bacterium]|uniref:Uncharacterized protein n=1 Tax=Eiseniibacteriota bacterium TaxID=2212470 RepID=A0A538U9Z9_UNCEI|nr:MAG: hypothetical protein E6K80_02000 [Candidatus Eisenbacteria bacterium]